MRSYGIQFLYGYPSGVTEIDPQTGEIIGTGFLNYANPFVRYRTTDVASLPVWEDRVSERWWFDQMAGAYLRVSLRAWVRRVRKYGLRHLMQFVRWLVSRFTIRCYLGWLRRAVRLHE